MDEPAITAVEQTIAAQQVVLEGHSRGIETLHRQQDELIERLRFQEGSLRRQEDILSGLADSFRSLASQATFPSSQAPSVPTHTLTPMPMSAREPKLQHPLRYQGEPGKCRDFLAQCEIFFRAQPSRFAVEDSRVSFILSLLTGTALSWAGPLIRSRSPIMSTAERLMQEMISVFDHDITGHDAATRLMRLRQGGSSVAEFSIRFRSLASETTWPEAPIMTVFIQALSGPVRDALATLEPPATLDALVRTAIRIDNRVQEREREKQEGKAQARAALSLPPSTLVNLTSPLESPNVDEPMQVDSSFVRQARTGKRQKIICFHCHKPGHIKPRCPELKGNGKSL